MQNMQKSLVPPHSNNRNIKDVFPLRNTHTPRWHCILPVNSNTDHIQDTQKSNQTESMWPQKGSWVEGNVALLSHVSVGIFDEELLPPLQTCVCVCVMFACVESCWFEQWVTKTGSTAAAAIVTETHVEAKGKDMLSVHRKSPNKTRFVLPKHWCIKRGLSKAYGSGVEKRKPYWFRPLKRRNPIRAVRVSQRGRPRSCGRSHGQCVALSGPPPGLFPPAAPTTAAGQRLENATLGTYG